MKRIFLLLLVVIVIAFLGIQFVSQKVNNPVVTGDFQAPANVKNILKRACYDCHSNETELKWFDKIAPVSWKVASHIKAGRQGLNFSNWKDLSPADQKGKLWEVYNQIAAGAMPLKEYELVHSSAKVSQADLAVLKRYVSTLIVTKTADTAKEHALDKQAEKINKKAVLKDQNPTDINGISYIPDYKNWDVVSTTDRFDNGTMRVIYGNDIAIKAIKAGHINPWPNGAIFAKVAWDKLEDKEGNVKTGAFKQVEYMIKDDQKFKATKGWGWARFKSEKLVPYGKTALFTTECINCHNPVSSNDFVFTLPVKH